MLHHFLYRFNASLISSRSLSSTVFVKGISFSSTEETLTQAFSQYGRVDGVNVIMDKVRCRPKGYAYVTFSSDEEAQKALLELNGKLVDGRVVILDTVKPLKHNRPDTKLKPEDFLHGYTYVTFQKVGRLKEDEDNDYVKLYECSHEERGPLFAKCFLSFHIEEVRREINNLGRSEHHPNIIAFLGKEVDKDGNIYICLERRDSTLYDCYHGESTTKLKLNLVDGDI